MVYDNRDKEAGSSLSWSLMAKVFRDCDDRNAFATGVGGRYRYYLNERFSLDADLYLSVYKAQDWETEEYNTSFVPFPSLGINYHINNITLELKSTFSPKNSQHSSTGDFNILFSYFYIGYSF